MRKDFGWGTFLVGETFWVGNVLVGGTIRVKERFSVEERLGERNVLVGGMFLGLEMVLVVRTLLIGGTFFWLEETFGCWNVLG